MRKKAVIFDFNGTMFFDTMFQLNAWNRVLEDYDMDPIPEQEYRDVLCGRGSEETVRYVWGENLTKEQSDEYRNKKKEYYQQLCLADPEHFQLVPGLETYLDTFKHGMPPHGGLGIGMERLTMQLLGEDNVRETTLFPRDLSRLTP